MKRILTIVLLFPMAFCMRGQEVGGYGFLDLPVSAHASALGGTVVSIVEPESSLADMNASLLCDEMVGQVAFSYMNWLSDINLANASYTGSIGEKGVWQGGIRYVNYGTFDGYDEWGNSMGTFGAKDMAMHFAIGYPLSEHWRIGGALRAIYTKYEAESAFAMGVDLGLNYYNPVEGRSVAVSVTNLGGQLKALGDRHISMPTRLTAGVTKEIEHLPFAVSLTAFDLLNWDHTTLVEHLLLSAEWMAYEHFYLGAGYNYRRQHDFQGGGGFLRGLSYGGGFQWQQWRMACSYARYNALEGSLHIELNYQF